MWWRRLLISGRRNIVPGLSKTVISLSKVAVGERLAGSRDSQASTASSSSGETGGVWPGLWLEL